jgi:hypothetical protein
MTHNTHILTSMIDTEDSNSRTKRTLRKRNADTTTLRTEPLSKRRAVRPSTLHNIHSISPIEDEELEAEFISMKVNMLFFIVIL